MAAGGIPGVQVLLDDGTGTFPYDITSKCRVGYDLTRGRQDEQSDVPAGTLRNLIFDNTDGRFTLNSTIIATPSPIRPDNRIRVKVTPTGGTTRNRSTVYVQEWPTDWPDGSDLLCEVTVAGTDAQARADRRTLLSVIEEEIGLVGPISYYTCGEPSTAASAGDSSGNQENALVQAGTGTGVTFGADTGPGTDGLTVAHLAGGKYLATSGIPLGTVPGLIFAFVTSSAANMGILQTLDVTVSNRITVDINAGALTVNGVASGSGLADGNVHVVGIKMTGTFPSSHADIYVDGVLAVSGAALGAQMFGDLIQVGSTGDSASNLVGSFGHLAFFAAAPTGAQMIAMSQAMLTGFAGESGTARLTRTAAYADIPVGTLDASLTNIAFKDITGTSAGDQFRAVADAELGVVFVDGSGNLMFHNRARTQGDVAPDITLAANQLLDQNVNVIVDMLGVLNYFAATALGGSGAKQVARNTVSELGDGTVTNPGHGRYPGSKDYLVQSDAEAADRAHWIVGNHGEPQPRIPTLKFDLLTLDAATQDTLLAAEADTWIRITGLPAQTPGGTTADLLVQGFTEHMTEQAWDITFNVVGRSLFQAWVLGDTTYGVLGSTTRLGV